MPDMHQGYGFPIGGVAAMSTEKGVISPGAIGYDINCGVRLLSSNLDARSILLYLDDLLIKMYDLCPSGVGKGGRYKISLNDFEEICQTGVRWAARHGALWGDDQDSIEDRGSMPVESLHGISKRAFERGLPQLGSLGAGNHFIEIDRVDHIFEPEIAASFGLHVGNIAVQIHSGSRGFGHQVCSDFVSLFNEQLPRFHIEIPDRELACAPVNSHLGKEYLAAMNAAANFAFVNRQLLANAVREAFNTVLEKYVPDSILYTVYDLAHNIGKIENIGNGKDSIEVCVHRKGATRALGPEDPRLPQKYMRTGQPILVPGSMGTASWVLAGSEAAAEKSINSCCHGAGRELSRSQARRALRGEVIQKELRNKGISLIAGSMRILSEEAPAAYKDVNQVVECIESVGIAKKVALLTPIAVIKG